MSRRRQPAAFGLTFLLLTVGVGLLACESRSLPGAFSGTGTITLNVSGPTVARFSEPVREAVVTEVGEGGFEVTVGHCTLNGAPNGSGQALLTGNCVPNLGGVTDAIAIGSGTATIGGDDKSVQIAASGHSNAANGERRVFAINFTGTRRQ